MNTRSDKDKDKKDQKTKLRRKASFVALKIDGPSV
jgi:hypothetical protein